MSRDFGSSIKDHLGDLRTLVDLNQNPGCGGDGKISEAQWKALWNTSQAIERLRQALEQLRLAPTSPQLCEDPLWFEPNPERAANE